MSQRNTDTYKHDYDYYGHEHDQDFDESHRPPKKLL